MIEGVDDNAARSRHSVVAARARLAESAGDFERAVCLYREAAAAWAGFGNVLEHGHALVGLARSLGALDRGGGGASTLHEAQELFAGFRASPREATL